MLDGYITSVEFKNGSQYIQPNYFVFTNPDDPLKAWTDAYGPDHADRRRDSAKQFLRRLDKIV